MKRKIANKIESKSAQPDPQEFPEVLDAEFEDAETTGIKVSKESDRGQDGGLDEDPPDKHRHWKKPRSGNPTDLITAYCTICDEGVRSPEWSEVAKWFGDHLQASHDDVFLRLFQVASMFLTVLVSYQYDVEPKWTDQPSFKRLREDLRHILDGELDPLDESVGD